MDGLGKRLALIALVVLVAANAVFWGLIYNRQNRSQSASFNQTLTPVATPSAAAPSTQAPVAAPSVVPLPEVSGRALNVSIVSDSIGTGNYASNPSNRYQSLMLAALQTRGAINVEAATSTGPLTAAQSVPGGLDLAIVEVGTDDLKRVDANGFENVYSALLKSIRANSPKAALVCAGTWSSDGADFDNLIEQDCTRERGTYVSLSSVEALEENRGPSGVKGPFGVSDDLLPNDAGHRAIAEALLDPVGYSLS